MFFVFSLRVFFVLFCFLYTWSLDHYFETFLSNVIIYLVVYFRLTVNSGLPRIDFRLFEKNFITFFFSLTILKMSLSGLHSI